MAGRFGFIVHPLEPGDVRKRSRAARWLADSWLERIGERLPALRLSHVTGVRSAYNTAEGWLVGVALTARQMLSLPVEAVLRRIVAAGRLAERQGARIIGLGALAAVVGDAGVTVARELAAGVTTGRSYTAWTALEGALEAASFMGVDAEAAEVAVVGATAPLGRACALLLGVRVRRLTLVGADERALERLAREVLTETGTAAQVSSDPGTCLPRADVVIAVAAAGAGVDPARLKSGAVVCDLARPRNVSRRVAELRDDVLAIEGGLVEVPGDVDFGLDLGYPSRTCSASLAETMVLALEERNGDYTLGEDCAVGRIEEIATLARKHGFRLAGLRSRERALSREEMERVRRRARRRAQRASRPSQSY